MSRPLPNPIVKPFSNTGDNTTPPVGTTSTQANQEIGFPPLESIPLNAGGIPVTREEFNGVINFYTQQILALVSGGRFTFDQALSDEQNGYADQVVLYDYMTETDQVSLIANNTFNFVTNRAYFNDGVYWRTRRGTSTTILNYTQLSSIQNTYPAFLLFTTLAFQTDLSGSSPYDTTTGIFTAPVSTLYTFELNMSGSHVTGDPGPNPINVELKKSSMVTTLFTFTATDVGVLGYQLTGSAVQSIFLNAGDILHFNLDQSNMHYGGTAVINSLTMTWDRNAI